MMISRLGAVGAFLCLSMSAQGSDSQVPDPPFFAPGTITVGEATTYRPTFTPDGRTVYFSLEVPPDYVILESRFQGGRWNRPVIASFSGLRSDAEPFLSPDGSRLVFASKRTASGSKADYDLWWMERRGQGWSDPRPVASVITDAQELYPAVSTDLTLYFARSGPDGSDLWRARWTAQGYADPERLPAPVNSDSREAGIYVAPDQSFILFESNRAGGLGRTDLYISFARDGGWTEPRNLGAPFNSPSNETSPTLSPDGRTIYFTSDRRSANAPSIGRGHSYTQLLAALRQPGNGRWHIRLAPFDAGRFR